MTETVSSYGRYNSHGMQKNESMKDLQQKSGTIILLFNTPIKPQIADYVLIEIRATNTGNVSYPESSIAIKLGDEIIDNKTVYSIQERVEFHIDGLAHNYYVPVGENRYYTHNWGLEQDRLKDSIKSLEIEIPDIEGVNIEVEEIELKKRNFFALDSYINYFLKNTFKISYINRYLTPVYVLLILFLILYGIFMAMFYKDLRKNDLRLQDRASFLEVKKSRFIFILPFTMFYILLLIATSFYFAGNYFFTVKSYWDSYKRDIVSGNLRNTYKGFYDFEEYISWLDKKIPEKDNLILLVRGKPVYIMAEMAYNLYPRDVKFIDTGNNNRSQIIEEIRDINLKYGDSYSYIVLLSEEDFHSSEDFILLDSYTDNSGFLFKLKTAE
jgi:hypothetical protein